MAPARTLLGRAILTIAAAGVAIAVVLGTATLRNLRFSSPAGGSSSAPTAEVAVHLPGEVYQLAFDRSRDAMWFAYMAGGEGDWLYKLDLSTLSLQHWALPTYEGNGFLSQVLVGQDGSIWVDEDYRIIRFTPETAKVATLDLDLKVPGALPSALDPNSVNPGTWVSAMATTPDGVVIGRQGVPFLTNISNELVASKGVPLPLGFTGCRDVAELPDGSIAILSGLSDPGRVAVLTGGGAVKSEWPITDISGNSRFAVDAAGGIVVSQAPALALESNGAVGPLVAADPKLIASAVAADPRGGLSLFDGIASVMYRIDNGQIVSTVSLPTIEGYVQHLGPPVQGVAYPDVRAMAVDSTGMTWFIVGRDGTLMRTNL